MYEVPTKHHRLPLVAEGVTSQCLAKVEQSEALGNLVFRSTFLFYTNSGTQDVLFLILTQFNHVYKPGFKSHYRQDFFILEALGYVGFMSLSLPFTQLNTQDSLFLIPIDSIMFINPGLSPGARKYIPSQH